jgi:hypothetical protein
MVNFIRCGKNVAKEMKEQRIKMAEVLKNGDSTRKQSTTSHGRKTHWLN